MVEPEMATCPACGCPMPSNAKRCPSCLWSRQKEAERAREFWWALIIFAALFFATAIAVYIVASRLHLS